MGVEETCSLASDVASYSFSYFCTAKICRWCPVKGQSRIAAGRFVNLPMVWFVDRSIPMPCASVTDVKLQQDVMKCNCVFVFPFLARAFVYDSSKRHDGTG